MPGPRTSFGGFIPKRGPRPPSTPWTPKRGPRPPSTEHPEARLAHYNERAGLDTIEEAPNATPVKAKGVKAKVVKQITQKHACERAFVCALAVSLLWVTSLGVSRAVVTLFVPLPAFSEVSDKANLLVDATIEQRGKYELCALAEAETCGINLEKDIDTEFERLNRTKDYIANKIEEYKLKVASCADKYYDTIKVFDHLQSSNSNLDLSDYMVQGEDFCTEEKLAGLIPSEAAKANAIEDVQRHKEVSDKAVEDLDNALLARIEYDINYMDSKSGGLVTELEEKFEGKLQDPQAMAAAARLVHDETLACFDETGRYNDVPCPEDPNPISQAAQQYRAAEEKFTLVRTQAEEYQAQAEEKLAAFVDLYQRLESITDKLGSAIDLSDFTPSLDTIGELPLLGFIVKGPAEMLASMEAQGQEFIDSVTGEGSAIATANAIITNGTGALKEQAMGDYNPPPVEDGDDYDSASNSVVAKFTEALGGSADDAENIQTDFEGREQLNITDASANLLEKADPRNWEFFVYENSVFEAMDVGFSNFFDFALIFDYTYRIIKSIMLIRKYWNISAINTPPADVRCAAGVKAGMFSAKKNIIQSIGYILTHPLINIVVILIFYAIFSASLYAIYEPVYSEYTSNCLDECWKGIVNDIRDDDGQLVYEAEKNGTMLYRNAYAIAEQYAFADGDYVANTQVDAIRLERELSCKENVLDSVETQVNQDEQLVYYQARMDDMIDSISLVRRCLNVDEIETTFQSNINAFLNIDSNANISFDASFYESEETECSIPFLNPDDLLAELEVLFPREEVGRVFNCSLVRPCQFDCSGPSEQLLRSQLHRSTCTLEWFGHASFLEIIMTTAIYLIANLSRFIFMGGLVKIFWRHLVNARFSYLGSCTESGKIIYPEEVTEKGESFGKVIMVKLHKALASFEREGMAEVVFALLLNAPWIAVLVIVSDRLAYSESTSC
eukprot:CAMPEP_0184521260 /NCGR_PEP_ID=MMETSP0198_2-20121128/7612_1 /TAXON_ID=1112570 /ORGANISM="Thraustochytrium sp., Strain LLF1b" /LENGTH=956 /DNA_ID=CAMNT_0026911925 /DNA_START=424 /DNA_END=3294 /DNA_ORIENTATION=+